MELKSIDNHKAFSLSNEVEALCRPLFRNTQITSFNIVREYYDGKRLSLSNRADWLEYHFKEKYYLECYKKYRPVYDSNFIFADQLPEDPMIFDARNKFDIWHVFTIRSVRRKYIEFYHFSTDHENPEIINWYVNNIPLLKQFTLYFIDHGRMLLDSAKPDILIGEKNLAFDQGTLLRQEVSRVSEELKIKRWFPYRLNDKLWLNSREIDVLKKLLIGETSKVIARELLISPRTVEVHIRNIKSKFGCHTKSDLINKVTNTSFSSDFSVY
jgi:LuxR family transcriptional regulator, quorum-sensing system regulator SolR